MIALIQVIITLNVIIIVYWLFRRRRRESAIATKFGTVLYIFLMALMYYVFFYIRDVAAYVGLFPPEVWNIISYLTIAGTLYGFYHQISTGLRQEFEKKVLDLERRLLIEEKVNV